MCVFSMSDCHYDEDTFIDDECTGLLTCTVTIDKARLANMSNNICQQAFNYVRVSYRCIQGKTTF